jgi:hypothetical protein
MRARRRVTKYDTLVSDQLQLCPAHWRYESTHEGFRPTPTISQPTTPKGLSPPVNFHQVSNDLIKAQDNLARLCPVSSVAQPSSLRFSPSEQPPYAEQNSHIPSNQNGDFSHGRSSK